MGKRIDLGDGWYADLRERYTWAAARAIEGAMGSAYLSDKDYSKFVGYQEAVVMWTVEAANLPDENGRAIADFDPTDPGDWERVDGDIPPRLYPHCHRVWLAWSKEKAKRRAAGPKAPDDAPSSDSPPDSQQT